jgi:hypothetical protein
MQRALLRSMLVLSVCLFGAVDAADADKPQAPAVSPLLARPVSLRGTLGDAQIQANLRPKTEFEGGIEGDYFVFGNSLKILLAGEREGEDVLLEESENGTDVSGQWEGRLSGDGISGNWSSADGSVTKPFNLKVVRDGARTTNNPSKPVRHK